MISSGNRFSGGNKEVTNTPLIQKGNKVFPTEANCEKEYTISISNLLLNDSSTFAFSVSLFHQASDLFLTEDPVITGMNPENGTINVRLKIKNEGDGAFEVKLFYTVFGGA